ncbi:hypothetical protein [Dictyoglomus sp.]|uniref:hypothetical protein n=1 Tax=Dictyoglomus sp. TaxID=28205 RepID=UPI000CCF6696|nr:MAG: hypothetical protein C0196_08425 [Dictyoglomus turgidum]
MRNVINIVKYEILGKKNAYLISLLTLIGLVFAIYARLNSTVMNRDDLSLIIFVFLFLVFLVGIILIAISNLMDINSKDLNYLSFTLPLKPSVLFLKRMIIYLIELLSFLIVIIFLTFFILRLYNTSFSHAVINYFSSYGAILFLDFLFGNVIAFFLVSLMIIAKKLPYENRILKIIIYIGCILYLLFKGHLNNFLIKIFPQKLPIFIPAFDYKISGKLETGFSVPKIEYFVVEVILRILVLAIIIFLYNRLLNKVEIRG